MRANVANTANAVDGDEYDTAPDSLRRAELRLQALRRLRAEGLGSEGLHIAYVDPNIESRKATSPVMKQLLQREYSHRKRIAEAELDVEREKRKRFLPHWMWRWA